VCDSRFVQAGQNLGFGDVDFAGFGLKMSAIHSLLDKVWHSPTSQKVYRRLPDDHVLDAGYTSRAFEPDQAYFTISLSRMFLADARRLWQGLAPVTIAAVEFQYAGQRQSMPFVVGKDLLTSIQAYLKDQNVEYRNTKILGPCPYAGGAVSLFIGLFQTTANSASTEIFGLLGEIAGALELTGLTSYLPVAKVVTAGLGRLLGLNGTNLLIGERDEFNAESSNPFREGFLAYVNCSDEELGAPLWTKNGELLYGATQDSARPVTRHDHCLVKMEWLDKRNDYTSLPFHASWTKARNLIWADQGEKARTAFLDLVQQVAGSPDLTARHRACLLSVYRANFEEEVKSYQTTTGAIRSASDTRAAGDGALSGRSALQAEAQTSGEAGFGREVQTTLRNLANDLPRLSQARANAPMLTDAVLNEQMNLVGTPAADPQQLADAMVMAAFRR
jgi:hypothetical protein